MKHDRSMKTKFKSGLRRGFALMTALVMAVTSVFPQLTVKAAALKNPLRMIFLSGNSGSYDCIYAFNMDGRVAYCMDHGKDAHYGDGDFSQGDDPGRTLSDEQRIKLALCMYYGYSAVNGDKPITDVGSTKAAHYAATQGMVWGIVENKFGDAGWRSRWMGMLPSADSSLQFSRDEAVAFYDRLVSKIKTASSLTDTIPSFTVEKEKDLKDVKPVKLEWNESTRRYEVTLTDDKKVLRHFKLDKKSAGNYHAEYDEAHPNRVTIWTKKANAKKTVLELVIKNDELKKYDTINRAADEKILKDCFYKPGNSSIQTFIAPETPEAKTVDPPTGYAEFEVHDDRTGWFRIHKVGVGDGGEEDLKATYEVYDNAAFRGSPVLKFITDATGWYESPELPVGTYYLKEISNPAGYVLDVQAVKIKVQYGAVTEKKHKNYPDKGGLDVYKYGEVLADFDQSTGKFVYARTIIGGATFSLYPAADIYERDAEGNIVKEEVQKEDADGNPVYNASGDPVMVKKNVVAYEYDPDNPVCIGTAATEDGKAAHFDGLYPGNYYVVEDVAPDGFVRSTAKHSVTLSLSNYMHYDSSGDLVLASTKKLEVNNIRQKMNVKIDKKDGESGKIILRGDTVFGLYARRDIKNYYGEVIVEAGDFICRKESSGYYGTTFEDLPLDADFNIREEHAPLQYMRAEEEKVLGFTTATRLIEDDTETLHVMQNGEGEDDFTFTDIPKWAALEIQKYDLETGMLVPQGDARLGGATYGLYARNAIHTQDGQETVYRRDDLVATLTTDDNGYACAENLYFGDYYLKEISASEGYNIDTATYNITLADDGDDTEPVYYFSNFRVPELVKKQPFQLIKGSGPFGETELPVLKGAGFTAYLKSRMVFNEDGTVNELQSYRQPLCADGSYEMFTDEKGYAVSIPIPYGTYVVYETTTPKDHNTIKPYEVVIREHKPDTPQQWRVFVDEEFSAKLKIVKTDSMTGKSVLQPDTEFKIRDMATGEYVVQYTTYPDKVRHESFFTNSEGYLILPERLPLGKYEVEEIKAPPEYYKNPSPYAISVESDTAYEVDPDTNDAIITVPYENSPAKGRVKLIKVGDILCGYDEGKGEFIYKEGPLAGAEFSIYAAEDIITVDMQLDEDGNRTLHYRKGDLVARDVTGLDGVCSFSDLPMGRYLIRETKAPEGYTLNQTETPETFVFVDDETEYIYADDVIYRNERQKVRLRVNKVSSASGIAVMGAQFTLYNSERIVLATGDAVEVSGDTITISGGGVYASGGAVVVSGGAAYIPSGTALCTAVSDGRGHAGFTDTLPFGEYYAVETKAAPGYFINDEKIYFSAVPSWQGLPEVLVEREFKNQPDGPERPPKTPPETPPQTPSETPRTGGLTIYKSGERTVSVASLAAVSSLTASGAACVKSEFTYKYSPLSGAAFTVTAAHDIECETGVISAGTIVAEVYTDINGTAHVDGLPQGRYTVKETKAPSGYTLNTMEYTVEVTEGGNAVPAAVYVSDERIKADISVVKKDALNQKPLSGASFGLYAAEDITDGNGGTLLEADSLIETAVSGDDGKASFTSDIVPGSYYIMEIKAPEGYVKSGGKFPVEFTGTEKTDASGTVFIEKTIKNSPTRVRISKTDITGEQELPGAYLYVIDSDGEVVEKWISTAEPHMIKRLPAGRYILREETAPYGYKTANDVEFTVEETAKIQKVSMKDEFVYGEILIHKTDSATGKGIEGVVFEVRDRDGNVIETLVTDSDGNAASKPLPIAVFKDGEYKEDIIYYVVETEAPEGYIIDKSPHEVRFRYEGKAPATVEYMLNVKNSRMPKTGGSFRQWYLYIPSAVLFLSGIAVLAFMEREERRKKKGRNEDFVKFVSKKRAVLFLMFFALFFSFLPLFYKMKKKAAAEREYRIINNYILSSKHRKGEGSDVLPESIKLESSPSIKKKGKDSSTGDGSITEYLPLLKEITKKYMGQEILGLIRIPAIDCCYPVLEGAEESQLSLAVGHLPCSAGIGKEGNCVIAGHSGSSNGEFFNCLDRLSHEDSVFILRADGESFSYKVKDIYTVSPDETECLDGGREYGLTLVTCAGGGAKRLICRCVSVIG